MRCLVSNYESRNLLNNLAGDNSEEATPEPIPNSEVKLFCVDGTAWVTKWESRTLPAFFCFLLDRMASFLHQLVIRSVMCASTFPSLIPRFLEMPAILRQKTGRGWIYWVLRAQRRTSFVNSSFARSRTICTFPSLLPRFLGSASAERQKTGGGRIPAAHLLCSFDLTIAPLARSLHKWREI